ncbi:hypothetical protein LINGRAHAP2_LOCUS33633 [Linum grandiflorum]
MNTKAVVLTVLLSLLLVPCLLHPTMADIPSDSRAHIAKGVVGSADPYCKDKANDSCDSKKCCSCKFPTYGTCYNCCIA